MTTPDSAMVTPPPIDAPPSMVKWRVQGKAWTRDGTDYCNWVAYLSASQVAGLLDQWVARWAGSWSDSFQPGDQMKRAFCTISVRLPDGEWVSRTDIGTRPDTEGDKGLVSDAFKRCGIIKWGAGRNVYELPTVQAPVTVRRSGDREYLNPNDRTRAVLAQVLAAHGFTEDDIDTGESVEIADSREEPPAPTAPEPMPGQQKIPGTNGGADHHLSSGTLADRRHEIDQQWAELQRTRPAVYAELRAELTAAGVNTLRSVTAGNVAEVERLTKQAQETTTP